MEQDIPGPFDTETRVHDVDLRGKSNTDWTIEWDHYIQKWNKRAESVVTRPLLQQPILYSHSYMEWYRKIIRRYISKNSSQYDELVRLILLVSHITTCPSRTEGNGLYQGLEILNSLNRLDPATLADASTAAPINPPDAVDGTPRSSPSRGGCGRGAPRGGGHAQGAPRGGGHARGAGQAQRVDQAPPLTVGTNLEDHPAAPESTPTTSSHPMDMVMSECVTPIQPSSSTFVFIPIPSLSIAHVEMTSTGPNQTCSPPPSFLPTTLEELPLAIDLVGQRPHKETEAVWDMNSSY
uniref:Aminotransferase-like plant mobile domain-containing protein n=1 Tax=Fagus sylvatica TaxID=28930 RepID=A0A2N9HW03_FAGSY